VCVLDGYDPEHRIVSVVDNNVPAEQVASCPKAFQPYYYMFRALTVTIRATATVTRYCAG
jgi:hypothetical protein